MGIFRPVKSTAGHPRLDFFRKAVDSAALQRFRRAGARGQSTRGSVNSNKTPFVGKHRPIRPHFDPTRAAGLRNSGGFW